MVTIWTNKSGDHSFRWVAPFRKMVPENFPRILLLFLLLFFGSCKNQSKSYVVTSPEIADIFLALDATDLIIGATRECELSHTQSVGSFGNVDIQRIVQLNPKAVFTTLLEQDILTHKLHKLGIDCYSFYPKNFQQMLNVCIQVGKIIGKSTESQILVDSLSAELLELTGDVLPDKRVYIEISTKPLMSAQDSSFVGNLLTLSGGVNIFSNLARDYCLINQEQIIEGDPQVIISTVPGVSKQSIAHRYGWQKISAVKTMQIYTTEDINPDNILRASPKAIDGIRTLKKILSK